MLRSRSPLKPGQLVSGPGFQGASSGSAKTAYLWCAETTPCKIPPPGQKIGLKHVRFPRSQGALECRGRRSIDRWADPHKPMVPWPPVVRVRQCTCMDAEHFLDLRRSPRGPCRKGRRTPRREWWSMRLRLRNLEKKIVLGHGILYMLVVSAALALLAVCGMAAKIARPRIFPQRRYL